MSGNNYLALCLPNRNIQDANPVELHVMTYKSHYIHSDLEKIADNSQTLWGTFSIEDILVLVGSNFTEMSHKSIV